MNCKLFIRVKILSYKHILKINLKKILYIYFIVSIEQLYFPNFFTKK